MGLLAERLGVKTPSLYRHVDGSADLAHRIAVLALTELADELHDAARGLTAGAAFAAAARATRDYVRKHPGRYAATVGARPTGPNDPLVAASERGLEVLATALCGYGTGADQEVHVLRMLRSTLSGFATLEVDGGSSSPPVSRTASAG